MGAFIQESDDSLLQLLVHGFQRLGRNGLLGMNGGRYIRPKKWEPEKNTCLGIIFGEIVLIYQATIGSRLDLELPENNKNGRYMQ